MAYQRPRGKMRVVNDRAYDLAVDAPSDGNYYGRQDSAWVDLATIFLADAASDGNYYVQRNAAWTAISGFVDAASDGNYYVRRNGAWTIQPQPIAADAPSDGTKYVRKDGAWVAETVAAAAPNYRVTTAALLQTNYDNRFVPNEGILQDGLLAHFDGVMSGYLLPVGTNGPVGPNFENNYNTYPVSDMFGSLQCTTAGVYTVECHLEFYYCYVDPATSFPEPRILFFGLGYSPDIGAPPTLVASMDMLYVPYSSARPYFYSGFTFKHTLSLNQYDVITPMILMAGATDAVPTVIDFLTSTGAVPGIPMLGIVLSPKSTFSVLKID